MVKKPVGRLAPALLYLVALAAQAQPHPAPSAQVAGRADPLDASARVPAVIYWSSLLPANATSGDKAVTWRQANDTVTRIGGWRTYTREAHAPEPAAPPAAPPAAAQAAGGASAPAVKPGRHEGHGSHQLHQGHGGKAAP